MNNKEGSWWWKCRVKHFTDISYHVAMVGDVAVRCVNDVWRQDTRDFPSSFGKGCDWRGKDGQWKDLGLFVTRPGGHFLNSGISKLMWAASNIVKKLLVWKNTIIQVWGELQYDWMTFSVFNCYRAYCISAIPKYSLDRRVILRWIHRWRIALQATSKWNAMNKKVCETCRVSTVVISSMDEIHRFQVVSIHGSSQVMTLTHLKIVDVCFCRWQCLNKMGTKFQLSHK